MRDEFLNDRVLCNLAQACDLLAAWAQDLRQRPHLRFGLKVTDKVGPKLNPCKPISRCRI